LQVTIVTFVVSFTCGMLDITSQLVNRQAIWIFTI
jgi:hypothetical protein